MCGIVGYIGKRNAEEVIISGLEKLEYRGYDSAGIALYENNELHVTRAIGKLSELKKILAEKTVKSTATVGIGHTRWATHGRPSENNAHPHTAGRVSLIHNGIIENYLELRESLKNEGCHFHSETDTEIAAHLLNKYLSAGMTTIDAIKEACSDIRGSYAFVALDSNRPLTLMVAKNATPIIIGIGTDEVFVASDIPAVLNYTRDIIVLEDGDVAEVGVKTLDIFSFDKNKVLTPVKRKIQHITWDPVTAQKGGYKHFMLKEIHEQSQAVSDTFRGRIELQDPKIFLPELGISDEELTAVKRIIFIACGTAWHACLVAKFYFQSFTGIPCEVDYASEFRYRDLQLDKSTLVLAVSQSGETADTIAAIELSIKNGAQVMAICNVLGSSIVRKVKNVVFTHAGPEISVASTKAFTTQLVTLFLLSVHLGQRRGFIDKRKVLDLISNVQHLPLAIDEAVKTAPLVEKVSKQFHKASDFLFLGRGTCFPIALEGALKLKEISYIHAEGYPAGEMKHGPIALIDEKMPVVVVLQKSPLLFEKSLSNLREVEARGAKIILVTDANPSEEVRSMCASVIEVPYVSDALSPIILTVPLQLLAYYVAVLNGTDVDLPRNLAKSVTVE
jgi:glucosamine--fructose-6-phosphate aminotransferase (isomerizing)